MKKKLVKISKKKEVRDLQPWIKSILNHFWWCCASCNEDVDVLQDKWTSILYHIRNMRSESNSAYSSCAHVPLTDREEVANTWFPENTPAYEALKSIVLDKQLKNDLLYLHTFKHSGNIEVYHGLLCKYCTKRLSFPYEGTYARTRLAVLDHNCGMKTSCY